MIYTKIEQIIFTCETSPNLDKIPNVRKLSGFTNYYRLRLGDYRIGFEIINVNVIRFIIIAHRKDIYKMFP
ncbi:MAG: type II toxin-antitoxin system RelE/ParE family toxin [Saprospiraceae bacterium]|nr:type II toxin-antitoxin system RelE/ParE family toxin [Saprospiraceae bacterium]